MSVRRTTLLEEMFNSIATRREKRRINELYQNNAKGSATSLMLRRVHDYWMLHIAKKDQYASLPDSETQERTIKINGGGASWFEKL